MNSNGNSIFKRTGMNFFQQLRTTAVNDIIKSNQFKVSPEEKRDRIRMKRKRVNY
jgi:hypothetical protein